MLIVEDHPHIARILNDVLNRAGYITNVAMNGAVGVTRARNMPPDLILMDVSMPVLNGFDAAAEIRQQEKLRDVPIVFLTSSTDRVDRERGSQLGARAYLTKPFSPRALVEVVQKIFTGDPAQSAP